MNRIALAAILLILVMEGQPAAAGVTQLVQEVSYAGGSERVLFLDPGQPKATVILLVGGDGAIKLQPDGQVGDATNFLAHTREHWATRNIAVLLPDVPHGMGTVLGRRQNPDYAAAVAALVEFAKGRSPAPVFLVGHSQGTNGVVSAASRLPAGALAGIVLASSITVPGKQANLKETVFAADLSAITAPALILTDSDDGCALSPPANAHSIQAALSLAAKSKIVEVGGGQPSSSGPCDTTSGHGFFGVENAVVNKIANWIESVIRGG